MCLKKYKNGSFNRIMFQFTLSETPEADTFIAGIYQTQLKTVVRKWKKWFCGWRNSRRTNRSKLRLRGIKLAWYRIVVKVDVGSHTSAVPSFTNEHSISGIRICKNNNIANNVNISKLTQKHSMFAREKDHTMWILVLRKEKNDSNAVHQWPQRTTMESWRNCENCKCLMCEKRCSKYIQRERKKQPQ